MDTRHTVGRTINEIINDGDMQVGNEFMCVFSPDEEGYVDKFSEHEVYEVHVGMSGIPGLFSNRGVIELGHHGAQFVMVPELEAYAGLYDEEEPDDELVHKPAHYTRFSIEPITFIMRNGLDFWKGNIIKYACRAGFKLYDGKDAIESEITDLQKVMRYAEMRINQLRGEVEL